MTTMHSALTMRPVLEIFGLEEFGLWPVDRTSGIALIALHGRCTPLEVGTAVAFVARHNDPGSAAGTGPGAGHEAGPETGGTRPSYEGDPAGALLHGLLTADRALSTGGMHLADSATGFELVPGCCNGLEDWRDWYGALGPGGSAGFGHDPAPLAERVGKAVRLTVDCERDDSPVLDVPLPRLRELLQEAESELADFLVLTADWAATHLPERYAGQTLTALSGALAMPPPPRPPGPN